jgi:uncharacterized protein (TIGR01741 family)
METNKMEDLYQKAAEILSNLIPVPWKKIYLYAEVSDDSRQVFFYFYPEDKNAPIYSLDIINKYNVEDQFFEELEDELYDVFTELWNLFEIQKQEKWTNLTFILDNSGEFNIDYNYNDWAEADSYEEQIIWEYTYLNKITEEDRPRAIIEKYLS